MTPRDSDRLFDEAVAALRDEPQDSLDRQAALERVARRLDAEAAPAMATATAGPHTELIAGCAGFRALLPAYRAGALSESRRMLLEDHLRECVPCRRAWNELRHTVDPSRIEATVDSRRPIAWRWAASLVGAALLAGGLWFTTGRMGPAVSARVVSLDGSLYALDGQRARPVQAGETFGRGGVLRTGSGSHAVLELGDGSRVELDERAELVLDHRRDGVVLGLDRGSLIVEAAKQRSGHLYVRTDDCLVSVVGTIFSVNHGARGSRVSVLDGEVRVSQGAELAVLRPGEQFASSGRLARVPLERDIAWSRNAPAYRERLQALRALGRELDAILSPGDGRTSTRLLDLAPASTMIWAAAPNVSQSLAEAWSRLEERAAENPALAEWWQEKVSPETAAEIRAALGDLRDLGSHLGDEIAIALPLAADDKPGVPLLLAEVRSSAGLAEAIDQEIARLQSRAPEPLHLTRVEDPATANPGDDVLVLWVAPGDVLAASPSILALRELQISLRDGQSAFVSTPFHQRLAAAYADGVEWLVAANLGTAIAAHADGDTPAGALAALGLDDIQHVVVESRGGEQGTHRAELSFGGERHGVAAWLAEPAPSGALEFVSPDAQVAIAGLTKAPLAMFDDLLRLSQSSGGGDDLEQKAQTELGLSLRDDLAAALGGDFALAIDGPWLPQPAWKAVLEVLDAERLQSALVQLAETASREAAAQGKPGIVLGEEAADGLVYHRVSLEGGGDLAWYVFSDGYLVAAPSRALIAQSLQRRAAGATLLQSQAFLERLPRDGEPNFSALVWQNLGASIGDLAQLVGPEGAAALQAAPAAGPTLFLAYGGTDRITFLANGAAGPLGMSLQSLLAAGEAFGGAHLRQRSEPEGERPVETPARPSA